MDLMFKCPVCGKEFAVYDWAHWAYKQKHTKKCICSWSCLRKAEKDGKKK